MSFVVTKFTSSNFHHALKLVLRGTGSGLYLHPTKASQFLHVPATPEAVAKVVSSFLFDWLHGTYVSPS